MRAAHDRTTAVEGALARHDPCEALHPVPLTYRRCAEQKAALHRDAAAELLRLIETDPDDDEAIDAAERAIFEPYSALRRILQHYRAVRDVKGWA